MNTPAVRADVVEDRMRANDAVDLDCFGLAHGELGFKFYIHQARRWKSDGNGSVDDWRGMLIWLMTFAEVVDRPGHPSRSLYVEPSRCEML